MKLLTKKSWNWIFSDLRSGIWILFHILTRLFKSLLSLTCVSSTLRHHSISRNALPDTLFRNFSACAVCCNDNFVGKTQDSKHENLRSVIMKWIVRCHIFEMASTPLNLNLSCREQECSNRRLIWSASKTIQLARSYERDYKASRGIMNHETNQMEET